AGSQKTNEALQALGWMLSPDAAAVSRRYGKVVVGGVSSDTLATADLQSLDASQAGHAKVSRCTRWHSLFDTQADL
ncbi:ABC transporter permease, partial [Pseudomonas syringae pv. coriandricola]